jgi:hypothetical protein
MNDLQIRQIDRGQSRVAYFKDNEAVFTPTSPGGQVRAEMEAVIADIKAKAAVQYSGAGSQKKYVKDDYFFKMKNVMRQIRRASKALSDKYPGIEKSFTVPYGDAEEIWLAKARVFYTNSEDYKTEMLDYINDQNFRQHLMEYIDGMETSASEQDSADEQKGGATGFLHANFRELGRLGRKADNIVLNKFEDDPEKLAAWLIASHLKAPSKSKDGGDDEGEKK